MQLGSHYTGSSLRVCTPPGISSSTHSTKLKPTPEVFLDRKDVDWWGYHCGVVTHMYFADLKMFLLIWAKVKKLRDQWLSFVKGTYKWKFQVATIASS